MGIINWALGYWPSVVRFAKAIPDFVRSTNGKIIVAIAIVIIAGAAVLQKGPKRDVRIAKPAEIAKPVPKTSHKSVPVKRVQSKRVAAPMEQPLQERCRKVYPAGSSFPPYYVCSSK